MAGILWGIFVLVPFLLLVGVVIKHVWECVEETWAELGAKNEWIKNGRPPEGYTVRKR